MVERATNPRQTTLNATRRLAVRVALATGATIATLIGAQRLALLDHPQVETSPVADATSSSPGVLNATDRVPTATYMALSANLAPAAPHLIVIRNQAALPTPTQAAKTTRPSSQSAKQNGSSAGNNVITPPEPILDQPAVVVQAAPSGGGSGQPAPVTRSSR